MKNKREILVFVSGVYASWGPAQIDEAIAQAREAAIQIWEHGFTAICPHLNTAHFEQDCACEQDDYLKGDLEILKRCDVAFFLPNYSSSRGALREYKFALLHKIPAVNNIKRLKAVAETL